MPSAPREQPDYNMSRLAQNLHLPAIVERYEHRREVFPHLRLTWIRELVSDSDNRETFVHTVDQNLEIYPLELLQLHSIPPPPLVNQQAETSKY